MGFNKRFLTKENITKVYESTGLDGVERYLKTPDVLINTEEVVLVLDVMFNNTDDIIRKVKLEEILYEYGTNGTD